MKLDYSPTSIAVATAVVAATAAVTIGAFRVGHHHRTKTGDEENGESWDSHVGAHGPLREIWPNSLYILEAPGCGMGPPVRNMTIYRVPDGSRRLVIFNGIAVNETVRVEIESLGIPTVLIVPNGFHRCCAAVWKAKYPELLVVCPAVAVDAVTKVVPVSTTTQKWGDMDEWSKWILIKEIDGWSEFETVVEVVLDDVATTSNSNGKRAMLVCDLFFTLSVDDTFGFVDRMIAWLFESSIQVPSDGSIIIPKVTRIARMFFIKERSKVENWFRSYARDVGATVAVITVGHGLPVIEVDPTLGCTKALEGIADQLVKSRW
jgi:hypothetical protein